MPPNNFFLTQSDVEEMLEVMSSIQNLEELPFNDYSEGASGHDSKEVMMKDSSKQEYLAPKTSSQIPSKTHHEEQATSRLISAIKFKRKPRKPKEIFMKLFKCRSNPKRKLNKEYLRMMLIRGQKGLIRSVLNNKKSSRALLNPTIETPEDVQLWNRFNQSCKEDTGISKLADTASGPLTDGEGKRLESNRFKTFNDSFCKAYFENNCIRKNWFFYIQLVFIGCSIETLQEKLGILCCDQKYHSDDCYELWQSLEDYLQSSMLEHLGLYPWCEDAIL